MIYFNIVGGDSPVDVYMLYLVLFVILIASSFILTHNFLDSLFASVGVHTRETETCIHFAHNPVSFSVQDMSFLILNVHIYMLQVKGAENE